MSPRPLLPLLLVLLAPALAGCRLALPDERVRVTSVGLESDYKDAGGRAAICDARPTRLTYRFGYRGRLERWASVLRGASPDDLGVRVESSLADPELRRGADWVEASFTVPPGAAPLSTATDAVDAAGVRLRGTTRLLLEVDGRSVDLLGGPLRVDLDCADEDGGEAA